MTRSPAAADQREQRSLNALIDRLHKFYGAVQPPPRDPFTLFVWEVLAVHSTPKKRDAALLALKKIRALTPDAMFRAPHKKLEEAVAAAGPYLEQRIKALRTGVDIFRRSPDLPRLIRGPITPARRALKGLPQMGEAGAYRMLLFAADHAVMPVDARVSRVSRRLGFGQEEKDFTRTARSIREALASQLPADVGAYRQAFIYMNHHGAVTCTETEPHCHVCPLLDRCQYGRARVSSETRRVFSAP
jgi:endonuclease III